MKTVRIPVWQLWLYRALLAVYLTNAVIDFIHWI